MTEISLRPVILSCGLALGTAATTQLRVGGVFGVPETLFLIAAILATLHLVAARRIALPAMSATDLPIVLWLLTSIGFLIGTYAGAVNGTLAEDVLRDWAALGFVGFVVALYAGAGLGGHAARILAIAAVTAVVLNALLLVGAFFGFAIPGTQPVYLSFRFAGLASNPNQLALQLVPLPFILVFLARGEDAIISRRACAAMVVGVLVIGIATLSEALILAWGTGALAVGGAALWRSNPFAADGRVKAWPVGLAIVVLVAIVATLGLALDALVRSVDDVYSASGQGGLRMALWRSGVESIAQSALLGSGPGPHAGVPMIETGDEAHNTLIDWAASGGILALAGLLCFLTLVLRAVVRGGSSLLIGGVFALIVFAMFHYVGRQPGFWLQLLLLAAIQPRSDCGDEAVAAAQRHLSPQRAPRNPLASSAASIARDALRPRK